MIQVGPSRAISIQMGEQKNSAGVQSPSGNSSFSSSSAQASAFSCSASSGLSCSSAQSSSSGAYSTATAPEAAASSASSMDFCQRGHRLESMSAHMEDNRADTPTLSTNSTCSSFNSSFDSSSGSGSSLSSSSDNSTNGRSLGRTGCNRTSAGQRQSMSCKMVAANPNSIDPTFKIKLAPDTLTRKVTEKSEPVESKRLSPGEGVIGSQFCASTLRKTMKVLIKNESLRTKRAIDPEACSLQPTTRSGKVRTQTTTSARDQAAANCDRLADTLIEAKSVRLDLGPADRDCDRSGAIGKGGKQEATQTLRHHQTNSRASSRTSTETNGRLSKEKTNDFFNSTEKFAPAICKCNSNANFFNHSRHSNERHSYPDPNSDDRDDRRKSTGRIDSQLVNNSRVCKGKCLHESGVSFDNGNSEDNNSVMTFGSPGEQTFRLNEIRPASDIFAVDGRPDADHKQRARPTREPDVTADICYSRESLHQAGRQPARHADEPGPSVIRVQRPGTLIRENNRKQIDLNCNTPTRPIGPNIPNSTARRKQHCKLQVGRPASRDHREQHQIDSDRKMANKVDNNNDIKSFALKTCGGRGNNKHPAVQVDHNDNQIGRPSAASSPARDIKYTFADARYKYNSSGQQRASQAERGARCPPLALKQQQQQQHLCHLGGHALPRPPRLLAVPPPVVPLYKEMALERDCNLIKTENHENNGTNHDRPSYADCERHLHGSPDQRERGQWQPGKGEREREGDGRAISSAACEAYASEWEVMAKRPGKGARKTLLESGASIIKKSFHSSQQMIGLDRSRPAEQGEGADVASLAASSMSSIFAAPTNWHDGQQTGVEIKAARSSRLQPSHEDAAGQWTRRVKKFSRRLLTGLLSSSSNGLSSISIDSSGSPAAARQAEPNLISERESRFKLHHQRRMRMLMLGPAGRRERRSSETLNLDFSEPLYDTPERDDDSQSDCDGSIEWSPATATPEVDTFEGAGKIRENSTGMIFANCEPTGSVDQEPSVSVSPASIGDGSRATTPRESPEWLETPSLGPLRAPAALVRTGLVRPNMPPPPPPAPPLPRPATDQEQDQDKAAGHGNFALRKLSPELARTADESAMISGSGPRDEPAGRVCAIDPNEEERREWPSGRPARNETSSVSSESETRRQEEDSKNEQEDERETEEARRSREVISKIVSPSSASYEQLSSEIKQAQANLIGQLIDRTRNLVGRRQEVARIQANSSARNELREEGASKVQHANDTTDNQFKEEPDGKRLTKANICQDQVQQRLQKELDLEYTRRYLTKRNQLKPDQEDETNISPGKFREEEDSGAMGSSHSTINSPCAKSNQAKSHRRKSIKFDTPLEEDQEQAGQLTTIGLSKHSAVSKKLTLILGKHQKQHGPVAPINSQFCSMKTNKNQHTNASTPSNNNNSQLKNFEQDRAPVVGPRKSDPGLLELGELIEQSEVFIHPQAQIEQHEQFWQDCIQAKRSKRFEEEEEEDCDGSRGAEEQQLSAAEMDIREKERDQSNSAATPRSRPEGATDTQNSSETSGSETTIIPIKAASPAPVLHGQQHSRTLSGKRRDFLANRTTINLINSNSSTATAANFQPASSHREMLLVIKANCNGGDDSTRKGYEANSQSLGEGSFESTDFKEDPLTSASISIDKAFNDTTTNLSSSTAITSTNESQDRCLSSALSMAMSMSSSMTNDLEEDDEIQVTASEINIKAGEPPTIITSCEPLVVTTCDIPETVLVDQLATISSASSSPVDPLQQQQHQHQQQGQQQLTTLGQNNVCLESPKRSIFDGASKDEILEYLEDARERVPEVLMAADDVMVLNENELIVVNQLDPGAPATPISIVELGSGPIVSGQEPSKQVDELASLAIVCDANDGDANERDGLAPKQVEHQANRLININLMRPKSEIDLSQKEKLAEQLIGHNHIIYHHRRGRQPQQPTAAEEHYERVINSNKGNNKRDNRESAIGGSQETLLGTFITLQGVNSATTRIVGRAAAAALSGNAEQPKGRETCKDTNANANMNGNDNANLASERGRRHLNMILCEQPIKLNRTKNSISLSTSCSNSSSPDSSPTGSAHSASPSECSSDGAELPEAAANQQASSSSASSPSSSSPSSSSSSSSSSPSSNSSSSHMEKRSAFNEIAATTPSGGNSGYNTGSSLSSSSPLLLLVDEDEDGDNLSGATLSRQQQTGELPGERGQKIVAPSDKFAEFKVGGQKFTGAEFTLSIGTNNNGSRADYTSTYEPNRSDSSNYNNERLIVINNEGALIDCDRDGLSKQKMAAAGRIEESALEKVVMFPNNNNNKSCNVIIDVNNNNTSCKVISSPPSPSSDAGEQLGSGRHASLSGARASGGLPTPPANAIDRTMDDSRKSHCSRGAENNNNANVNRDPGEIAIIDNKGKQNNPTGPAGADTDTRTGIVLINQKEARDAGAGAGPGAASANGPENHENLQHHTNNMNRLNYYLMSRQMRHQELIEDAQSSATGCNRQANSVVSLLMRRRQRGGSDSPSFGPANENLSRQLAANNNSNNQTSDSSSSSCFFDASKMEFQCPDCDQFLDLSNQLIGNEPEKRQSLAGLDPVRLASSASSAAEQMRMNRVFELLDDLQQLQATNRRQSGKAEFNSINYDGAAISNRQLNSFYSDQLEQAYIAAINGLPLCKICEKKRSERKEIIWEFVETELKYGRDLKIIHDEFMRPMQIAGLLTKEQIQGIFLNLEELIVANSRFAARLEAALEKSQKIADFDLNSICIGKIFIESSEMLHSFEAYCVRQSTAACLLARLAKEKDLLRIFLRVSQMENTLLRRMNLAAFLVVPVQRVTRYPLLLNRLYKVTAYHHKDRESLRDAQLRVELHLDHINRQTKDLNCGATNKIWRRISNLSGPMASSISSSSSFNHSSLSSQSSACSNSSFGSSHSSLAAQKRALMMNTDDIDCIKLRKAALDILHWDRDETHFIHSGILHFTQLNEFLVKQKLKSLRYMPANALLIVRGKPNWKYRPDLIKPNLDNRLMTPTQPGGGCGIKEAVLMLFREKNGRFVLSHEPLSLSNCVLSVDCSQFNSECPAVLSAPSPAASSSASASASASQATSSSTSSSRATTPVVSSGQQQQQQQSSCGSANKRSNVELVSLGTGSVSPIAGGESGCLHNGKSNAANSFNHHYQMVSVQNINSGPPNSKPSTIIINNGKNNFEKDDHKSSRNLDQNVTPTRAGSANQSGATKLAQLPANSTLPDDVGPKRTGSAGSCGTSSWRQDGQQNGQRADQRRTNSYNEASSHSSGLNSMLESASKSIKSTARKGSDYSAEKVVNSPLIITPVTSTNNAAANNNQQTCATTTTPNQLQSSDTPNSVALNYSHHLYYLNHHQQHPYGTYEESFELHERLTKESLLIRADTPLKTRYWLQMLRYHAKDLGQWRQRRPALANIMMMRKDDSKVDAAQ